jgi:predicted negative regulator of RcsB-dependent stress response
LSTHLVKHQKITKRQMKEDPLVTAAFKATAQWERHGNRILVGIGVLALLALLGFFMMQARSKAEAKASGDLFRANLAAMQGDYVSAAPILKEIVDNEPGTAAARDAMLLLGDSFASQQKPSDAAQWYQKYIDKSGGDKDRQRIGYLALASALEDAGQFGPAATAFSQSADRSTTDNLRGRAMLGQARCLARAGQTSKAVDVYKKIALLPQAEVTITNAANVRLGELQAAPTTP